MRVKEAIAFFQDEAIFDDIMINLMTETVYNIERKVWRIAHKRSVIREGGL